MDRNLVILTVLILLIPSLSARRAWIEITVAAHIGRRKLSLSARRAWIEM